LSSLALASLDVYSHYENICPKRPAPALDEYIKYDAPKYVFISLEGAVKIYIALLIRQHTCIN
jgi:hypothetical protein